MTIHDLLGGRYRLERKIGEGGMANVYVATDEKLARTVAVKILHTHLEQNVDIRKRFLQEAHAISGLDHPNILKIYDFSGTNSDQLWIVTEYVQGKNLAQIAANAPDGFLHHIVSACIIREICNALQKAHDNGIIHRDVKPENIMMTPDGTVKLMDFGIAKNQQATRVTSTGTFMGSPSYMSPEQVRGRNLDHRSDIYSLCVLFYEIVTGRLPYPGQSTHDVILKIVEGKFTFPRFLIPQLPEEIDAMIVRGMALEAQARFQRAEDLGQLIDAFLEGQGFESSQAELQRCFKDPRSYGQRIVKQLQAVHEQQAKTSPQLQTTLKVTTVKQMAHRTVHNPPAAKNTPEEPGKKSTAYATTLQVPVVPQEPQSHTVNRPKTQFMEKPKSPTGVSTMNFPPKPTRRLPPVPHKRLSQANKTMLQPLRTVLLPGRLDTKLPPVPQGTSAAVVPQPVQLPPQVTVQKHTTQYIVTAPPQVPQQAVFNLPPAPAPQHIYHRRRSVIVRRPRRVKPQPPPIFSIRYATLEQSWASRVAAALLFIVFFGSLGWLLSEVQNKLRHPKPRVVRYPLVNERPKERAREPEIAKSLPDMPVVTKRQPVVPAPEVSPESQKKKNHARDLAKLPPMNERPKPMPVAPPSAINKTPPAPPPQEAGGDKGDHDEKPLPGKSQEEKQPPKETARAKPAGKGSFSVESQPASEVFIDGKKVGTTNDSPNGLHWQDLLAGKHQIELRRAGYQNFKTFVAVANGEKYKLPTVVLQKATEHSTTYQLTVRVHPLPAQLTLRQIDGEGEVSYQLDRPSKTISLERGVYDVVVEKDGQKKSRRIDLSGSIYQLTFNVEFKATP